MSGMVNQEPQVLWATVASARSAGMQLVCSRSSRVLPRALTCSQPMGVMMLSFRESGENTLVASLTPPRPASMTPTSTCSSQRVIRRAQQTPSYSCTVH